ILTNEVGIPQEHVRYFVVSSALKTEGDQTHNIEDLQDSGFSPLIGFITVELKSRKNRNTALVGVDRTRAKLLAINSELEAQSKLLDTDSEEKLRQVEAEIREAESAVAEWNNHTRPQLAAEFKSSLSRIQLNANTGIVTSLRPGGRIAQEIKRKVDGLEDAKSVYDHAQELSDDGRAEASRVLLEIVRTVTEQANRLVNSLVTKAGAQLMLQIHPEGADIHLGQYSSASLETLRQKATESDFFVQARALSMGGMVGSGLAATAGAIIGIALGPIGAIIGSNVGVVVAGIWGARKGLQLQARQDREKAATEVIGAVNQMLGDIQPEAQNVLSKSIMSIEEQGFSALKQIVEQMNQVVAQKLKSVAQRRSQTREEIERSKARVQQSKTAATVLQQQMITIEKVINL
ncbi:MAG: DUF456 domain-containing protein, partial [Bacteroidota bacterium]